MPFDGNTYADDTVLINAILLLERGRNRVKQRYTPFSLYRPKRWFNRAPGFCMYGALYFDDNGDAESQLTEVAHSFLRKQTDTGDLIAFGTGFFRKRQVVKAYERAIAAAKSQ